MQGAPAPPRVSEVPPQVKRLQENTETGMGNPILLEEMQQRVPDCRPSTKNLIDMNLTGNFTCRRFPVKPGYGYDAYKSTSTCKAA